MDSKISAAKAVADAQKKADEQLALHGTYTQAPDATARTQEEIENKSYIATRKGLEDKLHLQEQYQRQNIAGATEAVRDLNARITALNIEHQTDVQKIYEEGIARNIASGEHEIEAKGKADEAGLKAQVDQQKEILSRAGTPEAVKSASGAVITAETALYDHQNDVLKQRADLLIKSLPKEAPKPTVPLGTPEFEKQIELLKLPHPARARSWTNSKISASRNRRLKGKKRQTYCHRQTNK